MLHGFFATPSCQDNNGQPKPTSPCEMEPVYLTPESDLIPGIEFNQSRERQHSNQHFAMKYEPKIIIFRKCIYNKKSFKWPYALHSNELFLLIICLC